MPLKYTNWSLFCILDKHCSFSVPPAKQTHLPHMDTQTHIQHCQALSVFTLHSSQCVSLPFVTYNPGKLDQSGRGLRGSHTAARLICFAWGFFFNHETAQEPRTVWPLARPRVASGNSAGKWKERSSVFARVNNLKDIPKVKIDVFVCLCLWCHLISRTRRTSRCFCMGLLTTMATNVFEKFQIMQNTQF